MVSRTIARRPWPRIYKPDHDHTRYNGRLRASELTPGIPSPPLRFRVRFWTAISLFPTRDVFSMILMAKNTYLCQGDHHPPVPLPPADSEGDTNPCDRCPQL